MARRIVILADESAYWKVAGLRQLERAAMAVNDWAIRARAEAQLFVLWSPAIAEEERFQPDERRLRNVEIVTDAPLHADSLLSTHLVPLRDFAPPLSESIALDRSFAQLATAVRETVNANRLDYLTNPGQIPAAEQRLLRKSGKSQDGLVSRFINRPFSREITRLLLKTPITPSAWTLAIFFLQVAGALLLFRGDRGSIILGLGFFQFYSILDGCDGEIARAKYLSSPRGAQLDTWCDTVGHLLMVVSLGFGLGRQIPFYFYESLIVAGLIFTTELLLAAPAGSARSAVESESALYPRHQKMMAASGLVARGGRVLGWLVQFTKRDVAVLFFLILGILGWPAWILHLLGVVAAFSLLLGWKAIVFPVR
ncbi:MAG: CDP-alcohol phosphatidyltransferase family protein [Chthoniobacterales bacterium]